MKKVLIFLAIAATSFTVNAQQHAMQQRVNGISINPVIVSTELGRDTVNTIVVSVGSVVNVTDSFNVNVQYFFITPGKGIEVSQTQYPKKVMFALDDFTEIQAGNTRFQAIVTALLTKLSLVKKQ